MPTRADFLEMLTFIIGGSVLGFAVSAVCYLLFAARSRNVKPTCGKCGYSLQGATSFNCSECGADLRLVGMTVHKPSLKPALFAILAGFLCNCLFILAGLALAL